MIPAFVVFLVVVPAISIWLVAQGRRRQRLALEVLEELAPLFAQPKRLAGEPCLRFTRNGFPSALAIHPGARLNVEVSFSLAGDEAGWITVSSLGFKRAFLEQIGFQDVQVGDEEFDERLEVWGSDQEDVRLRLQRDIRGLLIQVDRRWNFLWRLTPDLMVLRARISPPDRYRIETLAGIAFQILDLLDMKSPLDVVISKVQERLDGEARCPVCGSSLVKGQIVRCSKCRAAHHADCWQFNGLCATFACGSREKRAE
ncbi:MAG TPA: RING finger protein [Planctomycetota bacterium]|nr:RING finger protein [Planctomycetota bacterium]